MFSVHHSLTGNFLCLLHLFVVACLPGRINLLRPRYVVSDEKSTLHSEVADYRLRVPLCPVRMVCNASLLHWNCATLFTLPFILYWTSALGMLSCRDLHPPQLSSAPIAQKTRAQMFSLGSEISLPKEKDALARLTKSKRSIPTRGIEPRPPRT
jgi:hypothetical protein